MQAENLCCDSKPDKHSARELYMYTSQREKRRRPGLSGPLEYCQRLCCWITGPALAANRNITHRRVVTNDNKEKPLMIFETKDMVLVYNPEGRASCGMTGKFRTALPSKTPSTRCRKRIFSKSSTTGDQ